MTLPAGRYFLMGDNRDHSLDSRHFGSVARSELVGPVTGITWSWDWNGHWAELLSPARWWELLGQRTRWERIGREIR